MRCPRCYGEDVAAVGGTHYVCNDPNCIDEDGRRTQFKVTYDEYIRFPFNQIYVGRGTKEFYRKPYLKLGNVGLTETKR